MTSLYRKLPSGKIKEISTEDDLRYVKVHEKYEEETHQPVVVLSKEEFDTLTRNSPNGLHHYVTAYVLPRYIVKEARGE